MNVLAPDRRLPLGLAPRKRAPKLYDRVVESLRSPRHYGRRTEEARLHWIRRFLGFHGGIHAREFAESDVNRFLTHPGISEDVAPSTQIQALAAVLLLCEHVLEQPLDRIEGVVQAGKPKRLPVVLTRDEAQAILSELDRVPGLVGALVCGSGLGLLEGLAPRVKNLNFGRREITVRLDKGRKDHATMLRRVLVEALQDHLARAPAG